MTTVTVEFTVHGDPKTRLRAVPTELIGVPRKQEIVSLYGGKLKVVVHEVWWTDRDALADQPAGVSLRGTGFLMHDEFSVKNLKLLGVKKGTWK